VKFDASHQVNVKQSLTAAAISHAADVFHIENISLVPTERISLKKAFATANAFFWCGRPDLNRYGVTTEGF
jgi:hypothetical protein